jgi:hypothetical protein
LKRNNWCNRDVHVSSMDISESHAENWDSVYWEMKNHKRL